MKQYIIESLLAMGGKKDEDKENSISLLTTGLIIQCKDTGHKYTISGVDLEKPSVSCYRYDDNGSVINVELQEKDFPKYEAV